MSNIDINSNKYSNIISSMHRQSKEKLKIIFYSCENLSNKEKEDLLQWFLIYGNKNYKYLINENNIKGVIKNAND